MKRLASLLCAGLAILVIADGAQAGLGTLCYGGYQPWWNIFAKRNHCMSAEEEPQATSSMEGSSWRIALAVWEASLP